MMSFINPFSLKTVPKLLLQYLSHRQCPSFYIEWYPGTEAALPFIQF